MEEQRRITAIRPGKGRRSQWMTLEFDSGEPVELHLVAVMAHGLGVGASVTPAVLAAATAASETEAARQAAWRMVEHRPRTERELQRGLHRRGIPDEVARQTIESLRALGYVNDDTYASQFAEERRRHGEGARRVEARLHQRGIDGDMARHAAAANRTPESDTESARQALLKWNRRTQPTDPRKRAAAAARFLAGRGFDATITWRVVREVMGAGEDDDHGGA